MFYLLFPSAKQDYCSGQIKMAEALHKVLFKSCRTNQKLNEDLTRSLFGVGPVNKKWLLTRRKQQKNLKHVWHQVIVTESRKSILPRDWESWEHVFLGKKGGEIWPECSLIVTKQKEKKYIWNKGVKGREQKIFKKKKKKTTGNWADFLLKVSL